MTKKLNQEQQKQTMQSVLEGYVKHKNGAIFQVLKHQKDIGKCYLRSKNRYKEMSILDIKQGLVNGNWFAINEHEWKKFAKEDNAYIHDLTSRLVKRIMVAQLLIEIDDELIQDFENDKYFRNVLSKSNKQCERIVEKNYDRLYATNKTVLQNLMNEIEKFVGGASKLKIEEFIYLNQMVEKYLKNPEKYQTETVELTKID